MDKLWYNFPIIPALKIYKTNNDNNNEFKHLSKPLLLSSSSSTFVSLTEFLCRYLLVLLIITTSIIFLILFFINIRKLEHVQGQMSKSLSVLLQSTLSQESLLFENGYYSKQKCIGNNESLIFNIYSEYCIGNITTLYPNVLTQYSLISFKPEIEILILNGTVILEPICLTTLKEVIFFLYPSMSSNVNFLPNLCLFSTTPSLSSNQLFYPNYPLQYIIDEFFNNNNTNVNTTFSSLSQKYNSDTIQAKIGKSFLNFKNNSLIKCFLIEVYCIYNEGPVYVYYASII